MVYLAQVINCSLLYLYQSSTWKRIDFTVSSHGNTGNRQYAQVSIDTGCPAGRALHFRKWGKTEMYTPLLSCVVFWWPAEDPNRKMLKLNCLTSLKIRPIENPKPQLQILTVQNSEVKFILGLQGLELQVFPAHNTDVYQKYWLSFVCQPGDSALTQANRASF